MIKTSHGVVVLALSSTLFGLAGCGGGSLETAAPAGQTAVATPPSTAEGLWKGTTSDSRTVTGLVFENGTFYVFYSSPNNASTIAGVVQGTGTSNNGNFSSSNAKDFNLEDASLVSGTVSASYTARQSLNGSISYVPSGSRTFTTSFNANYDVTPLLSSLAGTFTGQIAFSLSIENATVIIDSSGVLTGTAASGCGVTGTVTPRTKGNAFTVSLTTGAAPCSLANQSFTGIAYFDSANKRLYAATANTVRTDGIIFGGTKP